MSPGLAARSAGRHGLLCREHDPEQPVDDADTVDGRAGRLGRERDDVVDASCVLRGLGGHVLRQRPLPERLQVQLERIEILARWEVLSLEVGPQPDGEQ